MKKISYFVVGLLLLSSFVAIGVGKQAVVDEKYTNLQGGEYDMVIIAPAKFSRALQKLIDHKDSVGINTALKTTEKIYDEYTGADKPEQIKYFIKDALDTWEIKYVLLVGGMKSYFTGVPRDDINQGSKSWHVPVRYTNNYDEYDPGSISDLYYADIYEGDNFSSWDSNENGIFAEWTTGGDIIDLYPDVYVGRLPCRNRIEVTIMVNKIITYETEPIDPSWFNKMVVVGGENWDDAGTNWLEGELICNKSLSYMTEFDPIRIFASNRDTGGLVPNTDDIVNTVSEGCGFLLLCGFANPYNWVAHWPGDFETWTGGIDCFNIPQLKNKEKLPICILSGNGLSQFNVTLLATLRQEPYMHTHGVPIPECFSWWLTRKINGGSIATIGDVGASYGLMGNNYGDIDGDGVDEPDCVEGYGGYMTRQFFNTYNESVDILGETWGGTITKYIDTWPDTWDRIDCKLVEGWILFGDPSLKIGGYAQVMFI